MSLLKFFLGERKKDTSAKIAKERISLVLIRDSEEEKSAEFLDALQKDLIEVISKYVKIDPKDIKVAMEKQDTLEVLEVKIEIDPEKTIA